MSGSVLDAEVAVDLRMVALPEGSLSDDSTKKQSQMLQKKNTSLNFAALPIQNLHEFHQGV